jgi:tRNA dimethylallyltransferase
VKLAQALNTEIISADSRQIYRGMTIGTGKDLDDYIIDGQQIPYHLIDICPAGEKYNVFQYQHDFHVAFEQIKAKGKLPILCGGTGLYIESVLRGYQFDGTATQETSDYPPVNSLILGIHVDREVRRNRISARLKKRLDEGMIDEIRGLLQAGLSPEALMYYGLEYKFVTLHVLGKLTYAEMFDQLEIAIHQFAKRQMTWFRGMEERRGFTIHWVNPDDCVGDVLKSHFGENRGLSACKSR